LLIGTTRSVISYHLRDIYSICRCCWDVAKHKWNLDEEEGSITISFTGLVMETSNREEGLYDHPITAPVVITLEEED
jgi:hypothetical protein